MGFKGICAKILQSFIGSYIKDVNFRNKDFFK